MSVLWVVLLAYAGVVVLASTFADRFIFFPPPPSYGPEHEGLVELSAVGGDTVAAIYAPSPGATRVVLFAHGNAEDVGDLALLLERYRALGVSVLAFDYPGYGLSSGTPSEAGAYAAADAAYDHLVAELDVDPGRIVAHGRSLGGAVMSHLAARRPVGGLVLESTFVSAYRVMSRVPVLPVDQFQSLKNLRRVEVPVLVMHGSADEIIAPWHGQRLAEAVPEARRSVLWVDGAGHNDLAEVAGDTYWAALGAYLDSLGDTLREG